MYDIREKSAISLEGHDTVMKNYGGKKHDKIIKMLLENSNFENRKWNVKLMIL